jgi:hypothetical protein
LDQPNAAGWKTVLLEYAITTIQQYRERTDSAMIIDAMDLYSDKVDGFVSFLVILISQD